MSRHIDRSVMLSDIELMMVLELRNPAINEAAFRRKGIAECLKGDWSAELTRLDTLLALRRAIAKNAVKTAFTTFGLHAMGYAKTTLSEDRTDDNRFNLVWLLHTLAEYDDNWVEYAASVKQYEFPYSVLISRIKPSVKNSLTLGRTLGTHLTVFKATINALKEGLDKCRELTKDLSENKPVSLELLNRITALEELDVKCHTAFMTLKATHKQLYDAF